MNSLEAIEKLRIGHEQEAQQCIEIFRSFCQWYQSQYNFEQIESTFWNACIYLIEKHDLSEEKLIDFFLVRRAPDGQRDVARQRVLAQQLRHDGAGGKCALDSTQCCY